MGVHCVPSGLAGAAALLLLQAHGALAPGARAHAQAVHTRRREAAGGFRGECVWALGIAGGGTLSPPLELRSPGGVISHYFVVFS